MAELFHNYIAGRWLPATDGGTFENRNPANGDLLGIFPRATTNDVDRAVEAATQSYEGWRRMPGPKRGEILFRAAELLARRKEELARTMTREMGKVLNESRGDVQEAIDLTYYMAAEGRRLFGQTTPAELPSKFAMSMRVPIGVAAVITPWNFPMAIPSWKIMPALIAGNTVVFKPSTWTPESARNLVALLEEAGVPPGVVNLVFERDPEVAAYLVRHPGVHVVSFTGSNATGASVAAACAAQGKRLSLEMGGKNAVIVMDDADLDLAVEAILWSAFGTSGQRCTAASRIIAHEAVAGDLAQRIGHRASRMRLGDGLDPATDVGPVINEDQLRKIRSYMDVGRQEGASLLCGGEIAREGDLSRGYFFQPTVFTAARPDMRICQEEIFGPVTAVITVTSLEEAIAVNNASPFGLSSSIFTRDVNRAFKAIEDITSGIVYVNHGTIGAEVHLPFGGTRGTGNGRREAGQAGLDVFTEWKTVYVDYSGRLQKAQSIE